jgi:hypothetical protein
MQEPPDRPSAPGDAVRTRDEESHGVSSSHNERQTEVGQVRTQRGAPSEIPEDVRRHGHEPTDVRVRSIVYTILGLIAAIAVSGAFVGAVLLIMQRREEGAQEGPVSVSALSRVDLLPPEPRLQTAPQADRRSFEDAARAQLNEYGWTQERGRARIPIGRAMELLANHGWPDPDEPDGSSRDKTDEGPPPGPAPGLRTLPQMTPQEPSSPGTPSLQAPP